MDHLRSIVKEEFPADAPMPSSCFAPRPMDGLHELGPPPFLTKTFDVVDDPATDQGFRKVDTDRWEFANEGFLKGQKHLLKTIKRRKPPSHPPPSLQQHALGPFLEVGRFGLDGEMDRLRRDKNMLMTEIVKLRQEQQNTRVHLRALEERLQGTEQKQQQMMAFLARAMQNPDFLQQLMQQKARRKELEEAITKKRRRPIDRVPDPGGVETSGNQESTELQDLYGYQVSELENLALEIQAYEKNKDDEESCGEKRSGEGELTDDFWEELLNQGISEKCGPENPRVDDEDVNFLAEKLGYLSSSSPK